MRRPLSPRIENWTGAPCGPFCGRRTSGWRTSFDCFERAGQRLCLPGRALAAAPAPNFTALPALFDAFRDPFTPPAPGKKPSSGSWLHSSAHYRLSQVRKARSSAAKSAVCKTPNCRRIKSLEMVVTARLRKEGCSSPASRQNARPDSPGRNVPRSELTATTIRSSDPYGGWATTAGRTLAADWSENGKGSSTTAPRL